MLKFYSFLLIAGISAEAKEIPQPPRNYIYDEVHLIDNAVLTLSSELAQEDQKNGNQILIAIFKSLDGEDLVDYTNRLFSTWNPGQKNKSNGLILAFFINEKKIRIDVGYGLEPLLTDAKSKRIISTILGPAFQNREFSSGITQAVHEIFKIIHSEEGVTATANEPAKSRGRRKLPPWTILILGFLIFIFYLIDRLSPMTLGGARHYRSGSRGGWFGGGGFGGGGFGGGGFGGGGGFSGGGGMSGGGGASGGW